MPLVPLWHLMSSAYVIKDQAAEAHTHQAICKGDGGSCRVGFLLTLEFVRRGFLKVGCEFG